MSGNCFTFGDSEAAQILFEEASKNKRDIRHTSRILSDYNAMIREISEENILDKATRTHVSLLLRNDACRRADVHRWKNPKVTSFLKNVIHRRHREAVEYIKKDRPMDPMTKIRLLTFHKIRNDP